MSTWEALGGVAGKALGGWFDSESAKDSQKGQLALAQQEYEKQKEFAQSGIQWKVQDALKAGIHPLAALGASTHSYGAQTFDMKKPSSGLGDIGQDIGRAVNATMGSKERVTAASKAAEALTLEKGALENDLLRTQIASQTAKLTQAGGNPAMPAVGRKKMVDGQGNSPDLVGESKKPKDRPKLYMGGKRVLGDPSTSNMEDYEDRYGDEGPGSWIPQLGVMWNDFKHNVNSGNLTREDFVQMLRNTGGWIDRNTDVGFGQRDPRYARSRRSSRLGGR